MASKTTDNKHKNLDLQENFGQVRRKMTSESESEVAQLCLTLCDPIDCSRPGSSIHGIFWARVL